MTRKPLIWVSFVDSHNLHYGIYSYLTTDRCNFSGRLVHCVLINYPAEEEHACDDVVTRISLSLSGN